MSKRELIDEIVRLNPTARPDFLAHFGDHDLREYLDHLNWLNAPAATPISLASPAACESSAQPVAAEAAQVALAETAVAVAEMDESTDERAARTQAPAYEDELSTSQTVAVAANADSEDSSPFADQTQEESQTYLF